MELKNSKCLVIGGAGFIGSYVVAELLKYDVAEVVVYDNLARGKKEYLAEALRDPRCSFYPVGGDIREIDILNEAMKGKDYVFCLAAMWLLHCKDFPRTAFDVNIAGTFNVLEACVNNNIKKLVWSSSASVYGDAVELPMTENHPYNNKNFYGATKIAGEAMATAFNDRYGLQVIGLRYMNVYGPNQDQTAAYTGVVPIMLNKIEANEAPVINGDGSQAYDFIYVEDVARCNVKAMESDTAFGFYNVGTEVQTSIKELCDTILQLKGSDLKVIYKPYSADDARALVQNRIGSKEKAEKELGFVYKYDLVSGLQKLIDWRIATGLDKAPTEIIEEKKLIMCGIAGIFNFNEQPVARDLIRDMTCALAHRGPDGEGIFTDEYAALGHRRLAILDVSEKGAQPMASHNGEWMIVFNGCVYNFPELREELKDKGHVFISTSDTEVICEGLAEYGTEFFQRLNGMFAIGAWHKPTRTLWLSRDRFGVKPLYYWHDGKTFLFSSEIKAFLKHPSFKVEVNPAALNEYFSFQNLFSYHTLFKGVTMLPPANTIKINTETGTDFRHHSWWDLDFSSPDNSMTSDFARSETKRLLSASVEKQMVSDVPVGSYLSGGMDSGSLSVLASGHVKRLYTFTAGFEMSGVHGNEAGFDERVDAELTANFIKSEHYEQVLNSGDIRRSLPHVVWHLEDLRVGMSYPNYSISRLAAKFVKVCLQGTGGDELYGGYPWRYYRVFRSLDQKEFFDNYYGFWQRLVKDEEKAELFQPDIFKQMDITEPRKVFERVFTFNKNLRYDTPEEHIQNSLYFEMKTFLPGLLLVGDKLAMANGLEERFPFLDNDLVDFAQKIPVKYKLANLENMKRIDENTGGNKKGIFQQYSDGKNVLRNAMTDILPDKIINREKQGFSAPDESWYRGENAEYVKELLLGKDIASAAYINPEYVRRIIKEHCEDHINHRLLLWSFMCFEWWCRLFLNNEKPAS